MSHRSQWLTALIFALVVAWGLVPTASANEQQANPELLDLQLRQKPLLRKLGDRVYAAEFIGYSNHGFIEGDDGIIVIDGGWVR